MSTTTSTVNAKDQTRVESEVAEAAILNREIKARTERLNEIKTNLRAYALKVDAKRPPEKQGEKIEIESKEGVATISFVKDAVSLVEGANPRGLKEVLTPATWEHLFVERVVLAEDFDKSFHLLAKEDKGHVRKLVQWSTPEPRVLLPK